MQKKLALVEHQYHSEVLRSFAQLFLHLGWQVEVFTNQRVKDDCYELSDCSGLSWYLREETQIPVFIQQQKNKIEACDLVILVTLLAPENFPIVPLKPKTILVIHNGHTFFDPIRQISLTNTFPMIFKDWGKYLRFYFRKEQKRKKELLASFDYLSLAAPSMLDYVKAKKLGEGEYEFIEPLPFGFFEGLPKNSLQAKQCVSIGIPGTIKGEGRDYEKVWAAFRQIAPELQQSVKLVFLGGAQSAYARQLIAKFHQLENGYFKIQYSPDFIAQEDFDQQLRNMDCLILPLKKSYRLGIIQEIYGHTNISGGINDMIRFGIPTLITPDYPLDENLQKMTTTYDSTEDLVQCLLEWIQQKSFLEIRQTAPELLERYKIENLAWQWKKQLDVILEEDQ